MIFVGLGCTVFDCAHGGLSTIGDSGIRDDLEICFVGDSDTVIVGSS